MICVRCHKEMGEVENKRMVYCPKCKVMVANQNFDLNKQKEDNKMAEEVTEKKSGFTLTCSVCGSVKKAGKARYENWKDKKYICRDCRKKKE